WPAAGGHRRGPWWAGRGCGAPGRSWPAGRAQRGEEVVQGPRELLGQGFAGHLAVTVEGGLAGQEDHPAAGGDHGVAEAGRRGQLGRVDALAGHRSASGFSDTSLYSSLAMMPRWTSLAPS